jgi:hypothetical protein
MIYLSRTSAIPSSLGAFLLFGLAANAQTGLSNTEWGSGFITNCGPLPSEHAPQPLVDRSQVDAGGAVIRHVIVRSSEGHIIREHGNIDQSCFILTCATFLT